MSIVLTLGTFDLVHKGHLRFFKKCAEFGEVKIGLNTDEFVAKYKGKSPILTYQERFETLCEVGFNDYDIFPNSQADGTIKDVVRQFLPNHIVVGSDWLKKPYLPQIGLDVDYLTDEGINLIFVPYDTSISTTELKKRILA